MAATKEQVLRRLAPLSDTAAFSIAQALLSAPDTVTISSPVAGQKASEQIVRPREIVKTWEVRARNAARKGFQLHGCDNFVEKLKSILPDTALVSVAFRNGTTTGLFWFAEQTGDPIGYVISREEEVSKGRS
jgi:hypothetical protein